MYQKTFSPVEMQFLDSVFLLQLLTTSLTPKPEDVSEFSAALKCQQYLHVLQRKHRAQILHFNCKGKENSYTLIQLMRKTYNAIGFMIVIIIVLTFPIFTLEIQFCFPHFSGYAPVDMDRLGMLGVTGRNHLQENQMNCLLLFSP